MPGRANTSPTSLILENHVKNKLLIFGLPVVALIAIGCSSGGADEADTTGPGAQVQPSASVAASDKGRKVVIEVTGAKKASNVTYSLGTDISQDNEAKPLPWKKTLYSTDPMLIVSVNAQNAGSGTITCTITVDGTVVKTNSSSGEYAIVTCSPDAIM